MIYLSEDIPYLFNKIFDLSTEYFNLRRLFIQRGRELDFDRLVVTRQGIDLLVYELVSLSDQSSIPEGSKFLNKYFIRTLSDGRLDEIFSIV